jgi:zinc transport system substrate-binding protein
MMRLKRKTGVKRASAPMFLLLNALLGLPCPAPAQQPVLPLAPLRVTCTTTLLSSVVSAIGGDRVKVHTIVPFGMCPGHFDLTPGEADKLRNADILLYHGFERFLKGVEPGAQAQVVKAGVQGNWMIPSIHTQAVARVCKVLTAARPTSAARFAEQAQTYTQAVTEATARARERLAPLRGTPVLCANMNRDFAEWCGLLVSAEFARDEDVSVRALHAIIMLGKQAGVALVIDNRQSSGKIGRTIADELGVPYTMLSNFPEGAVPEAAGGYPYLNTLAANFDAIAGNLAHRLPRFDSQK